MKRGTYQPSRLVRTAEAAEMIGISPRKLQQIAAGESCLDKRRINGTRCVGFTIESVLEFIGGSPDAGRCRRALRPKTKV